MNVSDDAMDVSENEEEINEVDTQSEGPAVSARGLNANDEGAQDLETDWKGKVKGSVNERPVSQSPSSGAPKSAVLFFEKGAAKSPEGGKRKRRSKSKRNKKSKKYKKSNKSKKSKKSKQTRRHRR
jgi:hypothetical protein